MAGCVHHDQLSSGDFDDRTVSDQHIGLEARTGGVSDRRGVDVEGQGIGERGVVHVGVRDDHRGDRAIPDGCEDGIAVRADRRPGVEHDHGLAVTDDPGVGAGPGERARVRGEHPLDPKSVRHGISMSILPLRRTIRGWTAST